MSHYKAYMAPRTKGNSETLQQFCWRNGGKNITQVCREARIARWSAYRAWKEPAKHHKAYARILQVLGIKGLVNV